jgi:hypothetical protein
MKRVNLDPDADYVGNRPLKLKGVQLIRRHDQRRPMIDIGDGDTPRGAEEAAEESRRQAILEERERSRAKHEAKAKQEAATKTKTPAPKPGKAKKPPRG